MLLKLPLELRDEVYKYLDFFDVLKLYDADKKLIEHFEPDKFINLYWEIKCKNHEAYDINLIKKELLEIMDGPCYLQYNFEVAVCSGVKFDYSEEPFRYCCYERGTVLKKDSILYRFFEILDILYYKVYFKVSPPSFTLPFFCEVCDKVIYRNTKNILHRDTKAHDKNLKRIIKGKCKNDRQFDMFFYFKFSELLYFAVE